MTDTLFDATLAVARRMGIIRRGKADSGGTTTALVDSNRPESADQYDDGTLWHVDDKEFSEITDFDGSTFTLLTALSSATQSGDKYAVASARYPLDWIIDSVNSVLEMIEIPAEDTSITTAEDTTEYTLPTDCHQLRQVYISTDRDYKEWLPIQNWEQVKTATGSADKVVLAKEYDDSETLRLVYTKYHPVLYEATENIDEQIPIPRIVPGACAELLMKNLENTDTGDKTLQRRLALFISRAEKAETRHRVRLPNMQGKIMEIEA